MQARSPTPGSGLLGQARGLTGRWGSPPTPVTPWGCSPYTGGLLGPRSCPLAEVLITPGETGQRNPPPSTAPPASPGGERGGTLHPCNQESQEQALICSASTFPGMAPPGRQAPRMKPPGNAPPHSQCSAPTPCRRAGPAEPPQEREPLPQKQGVGLREAGLSQGCWVDTHPCHPRHILAETGLQWREG